MVSCLPKVSRLPSFRRRETSLEALALGSGDGRQIFAGGREMGDLLSNFNLVSPGHTIDSTSCYRDQLELPLAVVYLYYYADTDIQLERHTTLKPQPAIIFSISKDSSPPLRGRRLAAGAGPGRQHSAESDSKFKLEPANLKASTTMIVYY